MWTVIWARLQVRGRKFLSQVFYQKLLLRVLAAYLMWKEGKRRTIRGRLAIRVDSLHAVFEQLPSNSSNLINTSNWAYYLCYTYCDIYVLNPSSYMYVVHVDLTETWTVDCFTICSAADGEVSQNRQRTRIAIFSFNSLSLSHLVYTSQVIKIYYDSRTFWKQFICAKATTNMRVKTGSVKNKAISIRILSCVSCSGNEHQVI